MQYSWFDISAEVAEAWFDWCPPGEYRYSSPHELPDQILPQALKDKCDSVLVLASGSGNGTAYYMVNLNRADFKAGEIDQMPLGVAFIGQTPIPSGCLIQHGNWINRTTPMPDDFLDYVTASGLGNCYPLQELPNEPRGSIADLNIDSHEEALQVVVLQLKNFVK